MSLLCAAQAHGQHLGLPGLSVRTSPSRAHSEEGEQLCRGVVPPICQRNTSIRRWSQCQTSYWPFATPQAARRVCICADAPASASRQEHSSGGRDMASKLALDVRKALRIGRKAETAAAEAAAQVFLRRQETAIVHRCCLQTCAGPCSSCQCTFSEATPTCSPSEPRATRNSNSSPTYQRPTDPCVLCFASDGALPSKWVYFQQIAEEQEAAETATDLVVRLGLAAFAISAYIKTMLCPSMSSYTPCMSSASLVIPPTLHPCALAPSFVASPDYCMGRAEIVMFQCSFCRLVQSAFACQQLV